MGSTAKKVTGGIGIGGGGIGTGGLFGPGVSGRTKKAQKNQQQQFQESIKQYMDELSAYKGRVQPYGEQFQQQGEAAQKNLGGLDQSFGDTLGYIRQMMGMDRPPGGGGATPPWIEALTARQREQNMAGLADQQRQLRSSLGAQGITGPAMQQILAGNQRRGLLDSNAVLGEQQFQKSQSLLGNMMNFLNTGYEQQLGRLGMGAGFEQARIGSIQEFLKGILAARSGKAEAYAQQARMIEGNKRFYGSAIFGPWTGGASTGGL